MRYLYRLVLILALVAIVLFGGLQVKLFTEAREARIAAEAIIAGAIARDSRVVDLSGLTGLDAVPAGLERIEGLVQLDLGGTRVSDVAALASQDRLQILSLRATQVEDLSPLAGLPALSTLDIGQSWVADLSPLVALPALERLDIGDTQIATLEPARRIAALRWLNLHGAYALDGSQAHYLALREDLPEVFNGRAFEENYIPGPAFLREVRLKRLAARFGIAVPGD